MPPAVAKPAIGDRVELRGSIVAQGRLVALEPGGAATVEWAAGGRRRQLVFSSGALRREGGGDWVLTTSWPQARSSLAAHAHSRADGSAAWTGSLTPERCRAARRLLGWSATRLSSFAGVSCTTITNYEGEGRQIGAGVTAAIQSALEAAGVEFTEDDAGRAGVRLHERPDAP